jgi:hypothetical protein
MMATLIVTGLFLGLGFAISKLITGKIAEWWTVWSLKKEKQRIET